MKLSLGYTQIGEETSSSQTSNALFIEDTTINNVVCTATNGQTLGNAMEMAYLVAESFESNVTLVFNRKKINITIESI